jgi:hypothetical protein
MAAHQLLERNSGKTNKIAMKVANQAEERTVWTYVAAVLWWHFVTVS